MNGISVEISKSTSINQPAYGARQMRGPCHVGHCGRFRWSFYLVLTLLLAVPVLYSEELNFTVVQAGATAVKLGSDGQCSPGTLISFTVPGSSDTIFLRVTSHTQDGFYIAVRFSSKDHIEALKIGDKGTAATPLHSSESMSIGVSGDEEGLLQQSLQQRLADASLMWVDEARKKPDVPIEVKHGSGNSRTVIVGSEFQSPRKFVLSNLGVPPSGLIDLLRRDAANHYWLSLTNYYWQQTGRGSSWIDLVPTFEFTKDGEVPYNSKIKLQATTQIKGFLSLLVVRENGEVLVLYPNAHSVDAESNALEPLFVNGSLNLELRASSPGPTHVVLLISDTRRPLIDFLRKGITSTYVDIQGSSTYPSRIGPGFYSVAVSPKRIADDQTVDDLAPESWDIAKISFTVAGKE